MRKYVVILMVLMVLPGLLSAEIFAKTGTAGLQFLKIGIGARALGMGEAYTAVTDDISSIYWNPAGLALKEQDQVMFSHTAWVAGINYEFVAFSKVTSLGTFGLSTALLHMDYMDVTEEEVFGPTGETFTAYDLMSGITYANEFTDKFSFGTNIKFLYEKLDEYAVSGFAVDIGSLYNTGWNNLTIGMAIKNFGPDLEYEIDEDGDGLLNEDPFDLIDNDGDGMIDEDRDEFPFKIPMGFSLGVAMDVYASGNQLLLASVQLDNCVDRQETYNIGMEYKLGTFKIRSGYQLNYDETSYSAGFGWTIPTSFAIFDIDYSYTDMGDLSESFVKSPQRLSLKMSF